MNRYLKFSAALSLISLLLLLWVHSVNIIGLKRDVKQLNENNVNLIRLNEALSQGIGDMADKIIEKAEWDKTVAEKIRQLDFDVKGLYGRTNQVVPEAVR